MSGASTYVGNGDKKLDDGTTATVAPPNGQQWDNAGQWDPEKTAGREPHGDTFVDRQGEHPSM